MPGPGMEFVKGNFGTFKHDMKREEGLGVVPAQWSTTAQMKDPLPTKALRVKSGYTGHVPHGRDHIGHSFKSIDNPGPPGKPLMEVMHRVYDPTPGHLGYAIRLEPPPKDAALYHDPFHGEHNPFNAKRSGSKQYEYGVATTAPVPMRIEKVLSGDERDMDDGRLHGARAQGAGGVRHVLLRPARGTELQGPVLHVRRVRQPRRPQQGGHLPLKPCILCPSPTSHELPTDDPRASPLREEPSLC